MTTAVEVANKAPGKLANYFELQAAFEVRDGE